VGLRPGPHWGSLRRSPRSLSWFNWDGREGRRKLTPSICIFCVRPVPKIGCKSYYTPSLFSRHTFYFCHSVIFFTKFLMTFFSDRHIFSSSPFPHYLTYTLLLLSPIQLQSSPLHTYTCWTSWSAPSKNRTAHFEIPTAHFMFQNIILGPAYATESRTLICLVMIYQRPRA